MCGKYILLVANDEGRMLDIIDLCNRTADEDQRIRVDTSFEVSPGCNAPAIFIINRKACAASMKWGFESEGRPLLINARSETLNERATFRKIAETQRCALPAAGYFEWRDGDNLRHLITSSREDSIYLAGIYRSDAKGRLHFVVLTRNAYGSHSKIHDRMPCLLYSREEARRWISGSMSVAELSERRDDNLKIEIQGFEQLMMDFDDED